MSMESKADQSSGAEEIIREIMGRVAVMGGNDAEMSVLNELIDRFRKGELSAEDTIKQAEKIRDQKQDYH